MRGLIVVAVVGLLLAAPMLWRMGEQSLAPQIQIVLPSIDEMSRAQPGDMGLEPKGEIQLLLALPVREDAAEAPFDPLAVLPVSMELSASERRLLATSASQVRRADDR